MLRHRWARIGQGCQGGEAGVKGGRCSGPQFSADLLLIWQKGEAEEAEVNLSLLLLGSTFQELYAATWFWSSPL